MRNTLKRFERGADICRDIPQGTLRLAGIDVFLDDSEVIYECNEITQDILDRDFEVKSGSWYAKDGWAEGKNPDSCPGMLVSKKDFFGNNMLEITCQMVMPSTHDINVMLNGSWDEKKDKRDIAYVTGIEAFWHGNIGFEKSPEYKLTASTALFNFEPEQEHRLQFGNIDGKIFVIVNGRLALEITDPDPIDSARYGKIGFEAFASWWRFKNVKVKKLKYQKLREQYIKEF